MNKIAVFLWLSVWVFGLAGCTDMTPDAELALLNNKWLELHDQWKYAEALGTFHQAIWMDSNIAISHYHKGQTQSAMGHFEQANKSFDDALLLDPNHALTRAEKWMLLTRLGDIEWALSALDLAISLDSDDPRIWNNKWLALYYLWEVDEALQQFDQALAYDPSMVDALSNKWLVLATMWNLDYAIEFFDAAILLEPNQHLHRYNKWTVLSDLGFANKDESLSRKAIEHFEKVLELSPTYTDALIQIWITYYDLQEYGEALVSVNKALITSPDNTQWLYYKGLILAINGSKDEARVAFEEVLDQDKNNTYALAELEKLQ